MILLNTLICLIGGAITICRQGRMNELATKNEIRAIYLLNMLFFAVSALSWIWGDVPTRSTMMQNAIIIGALMFSFGAWRYGPPAHTFKAAWKIMQDWRAIATGEHHANPSLVSPEK